MRSILLAGLVATVVALAPRPSHADHTSPIFVDFPELTEWGDIIFIGGVQYWRPFQDLVAVDWEPYNNGYLYEDAVDGLVWVSNDPWGVITEHYGYWRHNGVYGYVWRPLYPIQWRPLMSSMFRDDGGVIVGWSPFYYDAWAQNLYVSGWGFDDCYWAPFWDRVHCADFYYYHYPRFVGWSVGITFYDYDVYYRDVPDHCYRRDWDYRQVRHERRREPLRPTLLVKERLRAQRAVEPEVRKRVDPQPVPIRETVSLTPRTRSGGPWSPPSGENRTEAKKREARTERLRTWFQPSRVGLDGQRPAQSRPATPVRQETRAAREDRGFMRPVRAEQAAERRESPPQREAERQESAPQREARSIDLPRGRFETIREQPAQGREAQPEAREARQSVRESRPASEAPRIMEVRERKEANSNPPPARSETKSSAPAERVRAHIGAKRGN